MVTFYNIKATFFYKYFLNIEVYNTKVVKAFKVLKLARIRIYLNLEIKKLILFLNNLAVVNRILRLTLALL